jgi:hypothetical protein
MALIRLVVNSIGDDAPNCTGPSRLRPGRFNRKVHLHPYLSHTYTRIPTTCPLFQSSFSDQHRPNSLLTTYSHHAPAKALRQHHPRRGSGAVAARDLASKGYSVLVLEARDRVGGRAKTWVGPGAKIDVGCSWIHGYREGNPARGIAKELGVVSVAASSLRS